MLCELLIKAARIVAALLVLWGLLSAQETSAPQGPERIQDPRVLLITEKNSAACEREISRLSRGGGDFEKLRAQGWKIGSGPDNHLQIVDREHISEFVRDLKIRDFPVVVCVSQGEIIRSFQEGCSTPLDVWTFGFLLNGKNERPPEIVPEAVRVASTGSYRLRGNHWSVDGDWNPSKAKLITHLRGPNHVSRLNSGFQIEQWSVEELRSLHDDLHESEPGGGVGTSQGSYSARPSERQRDPFGAGHKLYR